MTRLWQLTRAHGIDVLIVIGALVGALQVALGDDADEGPETATWFAAPAIALLVLPLLWRRRLPFAAPAAVWLLAPVISFADGRVVTFAATSSIAGLAAAYLLGNLRDAVQARVGLAVVLGGAAIVAYNDPGHDSGDLVFIPLLFAIGWAAGYAMRERAAVADAAEARAAQAERDREAAARLAVAEERTRIARELHDIVAHSISVMVLQVGAIRHNLAAAHPEDRESLEGVERTGRNALAEMRRLLGAMRSDGEDPALAPQPGLGDLDALAEEVTRAGLPVDLHLEGEARQLPQALDLSAYRIIQEGLTNVLKHAHASRADVTVRRGSDELHIEVRDDGQGPSSSDGLGHGLVGIGERVKVYGGEMATETPSEGGFVLRARLPLGGQGA